MCRAIACLLVCWMWVATTMATPHVPLAWRASTKLVPGLAGTPFDGQAKRTSWGRDANHDFIDDVITQQFGIGQEVNISVAFSQVLTETEVAQIFAGHGTLRHVGENLAFALVDGVAFVDLAALAARPEIAMIEWQVPVYGMTDVATRATHVRESCAVAASADCGNGVNVAVIDYGVADGAGTVFGDRFVGGFDPYTTGSPLDGAFNPAADPLEPHGTAVAAILLGDAVPGMNCRPVGGSAQFSSDCRGVASGAGLVDVKACRKQGVSNADLALNGECPALPIALDWLASRAGALRVRVANISLGTCFDDAGDGLLDQLIDLLASRGVAVVVAGGNAGDPCKNLVAGMRSVGEPASASMAITVGQRSDLATVDPADDDPGSAYLTGPRSDYAATRNPLALKPDLVAPSQGLRVSVPTAVDQVTGQLILDGAGQPIRDASGSSIAAPQVAGAAALLLARRPMRPAALKELLRGSAGRVPSFENDAIQCPILDDDAHWDCTFGAGLLDLGAALRFDTTGDVKFPACLDEQVDLASPCNLASAPSWANDIDIWTDPETLQAGFPATIHLRIENRGTKTVSPLVTASVTDFGAGFLKADVVGARRVTLAPAASLVVDLPWTPNVAGHQCLHGYVAEASDGVPWNDQTQRNIEVMEPPPTATVMAMHVANPTGKQAKLRLKKTVSRPRWACTLSTDLLTMDANDPPRKVDVTLTAPLHVASTEAASCEVEVLQLGAVTRSIGGVLVRSRPSGPCAQRVRVIDPSGHRLPGVAVKAWRRGAMVLATTDATGEATLMLTDAARYEMRVEVPGAWPLRRIVAVKCGETLVLRLKPLIPLPPHR